MGEMYDYFQDFPEENPANWLKVSAQLTTPNQTCRCYMLLGKIPRQQRLVVFQRRRQGQFIKYVP